MAAAFSRLVLRPAWARLRSGPGLRNLAVLILLALGLSAVARGLADRVSALEELHRTLLLLSLLGLTFGYSAGSRSATALIAPIILGISLLFLFFANAWEAALTLNWETIQYAAGYIRTRVIESPLPDPGPLQLAWLQFAPPAGQFLDTFAAWTADVIARRSSPHTDALAYAWTLGLWLNALYTGFVYCRTRSELAALLPAGTVLAVIFAYSGTSETDSLVALVLAVLVLAALRTQQDNETRWEARTMDYPEDLRLDFSIAATLLIALIVGTAYLLPRLDFAGAWRSYLEAQAGISGDRPGDSSPAGEAFGIDRPTPTPEFYEAFQAGGLPRSHLLGAAPDLADIPVLEVVLFGGGSDETRYYWRGFTYPIYTGAGWTTGPIETLRYGAGDHAPGEALPFTRPVRQEIRILAPQGQIAFAAGDIQSLDSPFTVAWHGDPLNAPDPFAVRRVRDTYLADSRVPLLLEGRLRTAGSTYPDWVLDRYLDLPDNVPARVIDLAGELAVHASPFDNALAIESYLRQYDYTLELGPPPPGEDIVDYFLFDLQRGYCDYFASAMVVLSRAAGLPARLASGYTTGTYDAQNDRYLVSALNAHSWPEIYFPEFGWVPFEPTSGIAEIRRQTGFEAPDFPVVPELAPDPPTSTFNDLWRIAAAVGAAGILLGGLLLIREARRVRRLPSAGLYTEAFQWLLKHGDVLAENPPPRPTPLEFSRALARRLERVTDRRPGLKRFLPPAARLAELTAAYNRVQYAPTAPDEAGKERSVRTWWQLRAFRFWGRWI